MKKIILPLIMLALLILSACGSSEVESVEEEKEEEYTEEDNSDSEKETDVSSNDKQEEWEEHKVKLLDHYEEISVLDLRVDFEGKTESLLFWAIVPDGFVHGTDEDKQNYLEMNAHYIQSDLEAFFTDETISLFFMYENGDPFAKPISTGGWGAM